MKRDTSDRFFKSLSFHFLKINEEWTCLNLYYSMFSNGQCVFVPSDSESGALIEPPGFENGQNVAFEGEKKFALDKKGYGTWPTSLHLRN